MSLGANFDLANFPVLAMGMQMSVIYESKHIASIPPTFPSAKLLWN